MSLVFFTSSLLRRIPFQDVNLFLIDCEAILIVPFFFIALSMSFASSIQPSYHFSQIPASIYIMKKFCLSHQQLRDDGESFLFVVGR